MTEKPKYVPSGRRRQQNQRFHGAFTGGFSAGYYNTVGSREGWKRGAQADLGKSHSVGNSPREGRRPQQTVQDFMDEEDHDQWGGPSSLRRDYTDPHSTFGTRSKSAFDATIESWMKVTVQSPASVGLRLLRVLGWRKGNSSAYVPEKGPRANTETFLEAKVLLSRKRLHKVKLQQERVKIPHPKLDICGLGFEPYQNAPELNAYRERRKKQASQRDRLGQHTRDVYRVSDVLGTKDADGKAFNGRKNRQSMNDPDEAHVSYETIEDFIGNKSVGGFALREDEDDAYDDEPMSLANGSGKVRLDKEGYNNEIFEHSSDEDETSLRALHSAVARKGAASAATKSASIGTLDASYLPGALSSFAGIGGGVSAGIEMLTGGGAKTDDRLASTGFVLGGIFTSHSMPNRYRGPDVPLSYDVKRHEFGPEEKPLVLKALSTAVQQEEVDEKRKQALNEALFANSSSNNPSGRQASSFATNGEPPKRSNAPVAGGAFAGLAKAMRNRFTSVVKKGSDGKQPEAGLWMPTKGKDPIFTVETAFAQVTTKREIATKDIKIRRTVLPFAPHRLMCKRFHVQVPVDIANVGAAAAEGGRTTEASYFQKEIFNRVAAAAGRKGSQTKQQSSKSEKMGKSAIGWASLFNEDGAIKEDVFGSKEQATASLDNRPSRDIYKAIFEPQSDEEEEGSFAEDAEKDVATEEQSTRKNGVAGRHDLEVDASDAAATGEKSVESKQTEGEDGEALVRYNGKSKRKKQQQRSKDGRRSRPDSTEDSVRKSNRRCRHRKKRARSTSTDKTDLSNDSNSTSLRRERKRRRCHREKKSKKKREKSRSR